MPLLKWDEKYSVGIEVIDYQHEKLFFIANHLYDALLHHTEQTSADEAGYVILGEVLVDLVEYISYHFATEENFMIQHHYPEYEAHIKEHNVLRERTMDLFEQFGKNNDLPSIAVMMFLKDWLQNHILASDLRYAAHCSTNSSV